MSYPIDTVRRRMMMTSGSAVKYKGSMDCAVQVIKGEGFMSLMKGAGKLNNRLWAHLFYRHFIFTNFFIFSSWGFFFYKVKVFTRNQNIPQKAKINVYVHIKK